MAAETSAQNDEDFRKFLRDHEEFPWIEWLRSRVHFPNEHGTVVVGHEALISAVKTVDRALEELYALRAKCASTGDP